MRVCNGSANKGSFASCLSCVNVHTQENLAFFAAISVQPALRAVIEAALDDEWMVGDGGSEAELVAKRIHNARGLNSRELYVAQVGSHTL